MADKFHGNIQPSLDLDEHAHLGGEGDDGPGAKRIFDAPEQIKAVESGGYTYFCFSQPGTTEATAKWRVFRLDSIGNVVYADGNSKYDNIATDPTALTYTYG